jgi:hypothetical protein
MKTVGGLLVLVLHLLTASAGATVLVPTDLGDLAREARSIARGRVAAVESQWTDDRRAIETVVTLEVDAYLKGPLGSTLQFRVPGGTLGRYRRLFVGAPEFSVDERVVVFLAARGPSVPYVLGLGQGVYRLAASDGSRWSVVPPPILPAAGAGGTVVRGDPSRRPMPLDEFEARVRALAGGGR